MHNELMNTLLNIKSQFQDTQRSLAASQSRPVVFDATRTPLTIIAGLMNHALNAAGHIGDEKLIGVILDAGEWFFDFWDCCEQKTRSYLTESGFLDEIDHATRRVSVLTFTQDASETESPQRPPIGPVAKAILGILSPLPVTDGLTSEVIADRLIDVDPDMNLDASTIRKRHLPQLVPYGLQRTPYGYCIR